MNSNSAESVLLVGVGVVVGGVAASVLMKRVPHPPPSAAATVTELQNLVLPELKSLRNDLSKSVVDAESRLGTKLQTQERVLGTQLGNQSTKFVEKLSTIQQTNRELASLSTRMESIQKLFAHPKHRGSIGEWQLEAVIRDVFPPSRFEFQKKLPNNKIPDCILKLPPPIGFLCIDSKFPMDAFLGKEGTGGVDGQDNSGSKSTDTASTTSSKTIEDTLKKHIKDVSSKYIVPGYTAEYAILFLPSEGVFLQVVQNQELVSEAHKQKVWLACPTTLQAVLTTLQGVVRNLALQENAQDFVKNVEALTSDVERLEVRADKVEKHLENARESLRQMRISMDKVAKHKKTLGLLQRNEVNDETSTMTLPVVTSVETTAPASSSAPASLTLDKTNPTKDGPATGVNGLVK